MSSTLISAASPRPLVVVIAGPTASGKSDVAAEICAGQRGLIVSADSVQAYRKLQIGANKPDAAELQRTPHILLDVVDHTQSYNAAEWRRDALFAIQELVGGGTREPVHETSRDSPWVVQDLQRQTEIMHAIERARQIKQSPQHSSQDVGTSFLPVVVGGTMMYLQWLIHGRPDAVRPTEAALQVALQTITNFQAEQDWAGAVQHVSDQGAVYQQQVQKLFPFDWYRIRRILEVALTVRDLQQTKENVTNTKIEEEIDHMMYSGIRENPLASLGYDVRCFFLCPDDRMKHTKVIDERCEQMIMRGLIKETSDLVLAGEMPDMALKAIGYRQTLDYLQRENPNDDDEEAFADYVAKFTAATRQYSKRQMQWFRRDSEFAFVPVPLDVTNPAERVHQVAEKVLRLMSLPREEYEQERLSPTSESAIMRSTNAAQAKGMRIYQLEKRWLTDGSRELRDAIAEADACTQRFQAKRLRHEQPTVSISDGIS
jgi:tRNA dimethylallyltransferase